MGKSLLLNRIRFDHLLYFLVLFRGLLQLDRSNNTFILIVGSVILLLLYLFYWVYTNPFKIDKIFLCYTVFAIYSIFLLITKGIGLKAINDFVSYMLYFLLAIYFMHQRSINRKKKIKIFLLIFFVLLIIQIVLVFFLKIGGRNNLGSILGHANSANLFLGFLSLYLAFKKKWILTFVLMVCMLILGGRTSLISTSIVVVGIYLIHRSHSYEKVKLRIKILLFFGVVIFSFLLYKGTVVDWHETINLPFFNDTARVLSYNSIKWRILHWTHYLSRMDTIGIILFGNGIGAHAEVSTPLYGRFFEVHNDFLKIFFDLGLIGLIIFLWSDLSLGRYFIKYNKGHYIYIFFLYYVRYSYMFFDNVVTNFMGTLIFVFFLMSFSSEGKINYHGQKRQFHNYI